MTLILGEDPLESYAMRLGQAQQELAEVRRWIRYVLAAEYAEGPLPVRARRDLESALAGEQSPPGWVEPAKSRGDER